MHGNPPLRLQQQTPHPNVETPKILFAADRLRPHRISYDTPTFHPLIEGGPRPASSFAEEGETQPRLRSVLLVMQKVSGSCVLRVGSVEFWALLQLHSRSDRL